MNVFQVAAIVIPIIVLIWAAAISFKIVRPTQRGLVERFGKYHRFVNQGITFLIPFVDHIIRVNITERMSPVEPQDIITKDKVFMKTDAVIFYKIKPDEISVKASEYQVANFQSQIDTLARTVLRDIIGNMDMAEANLSRIKINDGLKAQLDLLTNDWGIEITRAEIKDIIPPQDLIDSMETVLKADNTRQANEKTAIAVATLAKGQADAAINTATGERQAAILRAEGQRQATILSAEANQQLQVLEADGKRQALISIATGEAEAIKLTNTATNTYFVGNAVKMKELEVTQASLQSNTKVIVPEGKTVSLILDERNNLAEKSSIIPVMQPQPQPKPTSESENQTYMATD